MTRYEWFSTQNKNRETRLWFEYMKRRCERLTVLELGEVEIDWKITKRVNKTKLRQVQLNKDMILDEKE